MKKYISPFLMLVIITWVVAPGWAQAHSGFYLSGDLGANFSSGVEFDGDSNDVDSLCDALTNPGLTGCNPDFEYTGNFVRSWASEFDGGQGILAGAAVGYSFGAQDPNSPLGGFRVELEYFYRESKHDQNATIGKVSAETRAKFDRGEFGMGGPTERLGSITSHNLFGNLYYDFINTSRFTPYIGIGGGIGVTEADWGSNWTRTEDRTILVNAPERLYGSSSVAHTTLSDTLYGLQILFGVDYAVTEAMSLGLKGRWVRFNSFSDGLVWDPLRSHVPYVGGTAEDPMNPMSGHMSTSDIEFFGISVNMKYHF